jgi:site-specific DNA-methyltransferase (adenine-specific)
MKEVPDGSVDMVLTDPPYGTTACKWDTVIPFEPLWSEYKRIIKKNGAIVLFGKEPFSSYLRLSNVGWFKYDWVWRKDTKSNFPQAAHQPLNNIEIVSVFSGGYARNFKEGDPNRENIMPYNPQMVNGESYKLPKPSKTTQIFSDNHKNGMFAHKEKDTTKRYPFNLLDFKTDRKRLHPTQKPVALCEYLIKTYTNEGEWVLDNCMGSCTTGVACMNTGRKFIGIEMDDNYFNIAKERITNV